MSKGKEDNFDSQNPPPSTMANKTVTITGGYVMGLATKLQGPFMRDIFSLATEHDWHIRVGGQHYV